MMEWPTDIKVEPLWKMFNSIPRNKDIDQLLVMPVHFGKSERNNYFFCTKKKFFENKQQIVHAGVIDFFKLWEGATERISKEINNKVQYEKLDSRVKDFCCKIKEYKDRIQTIKDQRTNNLNEALELASNVIDASTECVIRLPFPYYWYENGIVYKILEEIRNGDIKLEGQMPDLYYMEGPNNHDVSYAPRQLRQVYAVYVDRKKPQELGKYHKIPGGTNKDSNLSHPLHERYQKIFYEIHASFNIFGIKELQDKKSIVLPIYDFYIDSKGYGGIQGVYIFYIEQEKKTEEELSALSKSINSIMKPKVKNISHDIYSANILCIQDQKIHQRDFISYFLNTIVYVQDWENIWVTTEKLSGNKCFSKEHITHHWGREKTQLNEGVFEYKWIDLLGSDGSNREYSEQSNEVQKNEEKYFEFCLQDMTFLFRDKKNIHQYMGKSKYLICEYPKASIIPKECEEKAMTKFKSELEFRFLQVFQFIIPMWQREQAKRNIEKVQVSAHQLSHTLGHVCDALIEELKGKINEYLEEDKKFLDKIELKCSCKTGFDDTVKNKIEEIENGLDLMKYNNPLTGEILNPEHFNEKYQRTLLENCNFFNYLKNRFNYLSSNSEDSCKLDVKNLQTRSLWEILDYFNSQPILHRHLTYGTPSGEHVVCLYPHDEMLCETTKAFIFHQAQFQPFYVILENYVRNVAKYGEPLLEKIDCYIKIEKKNNQFFISLYESTKKQLSEEYLKKVQRGFDKWNGLEEFKYRGKREVREAVKNLAFPEKEEFQTNLVLVDDEGEIQEDWSQSRDMYNYFKDQLCQYRLSFEYKFRIHTWPQKLIIFISNADPEAKVLYLRNGVWVANAGCNDDIIEKSGLFYDKIYYNCALEDEGRKGELIDPFTLQRERTRSVKDPHELDRRLQEAGLTEQERDNIIRLTKNT